MSEAILLFCCRSCLKGNGIEREYYDILGVEYPKTATIDDIKKAYKKKSLETHPDKLRQRNVTVTPEHQQQFLKVKEAYDVLSDPRKRRLYDELGASGLKLIDSPTEVDPTELLKNFQNNHADRWKIIFFIALIFATILILPILFSLKSDGDIDAPWMAIWTPMWLVDAIMLIVVCLTIVMSNAEKDPEEKQPVDENDKWYIKLLLLLQTCLFILIQLFVFMKLDGDIKWNWFSVFIPWYIYEGLVIIELLLTAIAHVPEPDYEAYHEMPEGFDEGGDDSEGAKRIYLESKYYEALMHQFTARKDIVISLLRIWFALFLAARISGDVDWDWGLVMLPIWLYFAVHIFVWRYLKRMGMHLLDGIDIEGIQAGTVPFDPKTQVKIQVGMELVQASSSSFYGRLPLLLMALLLVSRLEVSKFSTFIILIPIFFFIFICICFVGCGICCLSMADIDKLKESREDVYANADPQADRPADESGGRSSENDVTSSLIREQDAVIVPPLSESSEKYGTFTPPSETVRKPAAAPAADSNDID